MRNVLLYFWLGIVALGAQTVDATGVWLASGVPFAPWTVRLKQDGAKLTGTMQQNGGLPGTVDIYEGRVDGDNVSFKAKSPDGARAITFTGKINGDEITLHRATQIITDESPGGAGLFGTKAAPQFTIRRGAGSGPGSRFSHKGVEIDVSAIQPAPDRDAILDGLRRQIDIVDMSVTNPEQKAFMKSVPLTMAASPLPGSDGAVYSGRTKSVVLQTRYFGADKPVILHELMHAYHDQKLPDGFRNAEILKLYQEARTGGNFPAGSYMLTKVAEYFAMMSSVYLYGSAQKDPLTREAIKEKQPDCYQWLVREFGVR